MYARKVRAYPSEALLDAPLLEKLQITASNIRIGWKSLPGTNTLAYLAHSSVTKKIKCS
jgi:hypothetical protein